MRRIWKHSDNEFDPWLLLRTFLVDKEAARFLVYEMDKYTRMIKGAGSLSGMFSWSRSPQGHDYWRNVANQIGEGPFDGK